MNPRESKGGLIRCPACGNECLALHKPRYAGFARVGEDCICTGCGHVLSGGSAPIRPEAPTLFDEEDRAPVPEVFRDEERGRLCRYCRHYVVNPFRQWCAEHEREVEATESCDRFSPRPPSEEEQRRHETP